MAGFMEVHRVRSMSVIEAHRQSSYVEFLKPTTLAGLEQCVAGWLLSASVQIATGPWAGGIAGWLNRAGSPSFVYGESTGYWLAWLCSREVCCSDVAPRASSAVAFIDTIWSGPAPPPTRMYLDTYVEDWRNGVVFSFDMAMMLRGLACASRLIGMKPCAMAARRILPWIMQCISDDGTLSPCLPLTDDFGQLPARWSTQPGPYQMKMAAALLALPDDWLPDELRAAAQATLERWRHQEARYTNLHAKSYAMEGIALAGGTTAIDLDRIRMPADHRMKEGAPERDGLARADVLAQAIRLLLLVKGPAAADALKRAYILATELVGHIDADGAVLFHRDIGPRNVWCSIFAAQAFAWLAARQSGEVIDRVSLV